MATPIRPSNSRVNLSFSGRKLSGRDLLSKSDPLVTVSTMINGQWVEAGRTEHVKNNHNPKFTKTVQVTYAFEAANSIRVSVYDHDDSDEKLKHQDFIGEAFFTLGEILSSKGQQVERELKNHQRGNDGYGFITVSGEEVRESNMTLELVMHGEHLDKKDFFGSSDPYFIISRKIGQTNYATVFTSEVVKNNLNPKWNKFSITVQALCNADFHQTIRIQCYDHDEHSAHDLIGECEVPAGELTKPRSFDLVNPKKAGKSGYKNSGVIVLDSSKQVIEPTFLDYIVGGYNISQVFAIDFTGSNGEPNQTSSLHYLRPDTMNGYQVGIHSIGNIVSYYDSDKKFPVFGFGGIFYGTSSVSHCYAMNGNPSNPEVAGIDGVLDLYARTVATVNLYGPTNFASVIDYCCKMAEAAKLAEQKVYYIMLIYTDGEITDMRETINKIVDASSLPISIIIVGIGSADFSSMERLDGDKQKLTSSHGTVASRDIVQFVPLRDIIQRGPEELARVTLAEVPGQFLAYVKANKIPPPPRFV
eukprot:TRINITY_DN422_c0_g1_i5.p1 TRINITY_DN422_c0_g1~~TRINITY_DN422_c0_g1_i5.p1  ORF type:complete len:530 (-),score=103.06 TRINITY_DN422_c0_g1_i5:324-1913(-)